uniref:Proline rich acidic protein 1 n=1 Tax=Bos indicus x Bos taurus TaxID=30522 RepID=A0A4W2ID42_BOBOX
MQEDRHSCPAAAGPRHCSGSPFHLLPRPRRPCRKDRQRNRPPCSGHQLGVGGGGAAPVLSPSVRPRAGWIRQCLEGVGAAPPSRPTPTPPRPLRALCCVSPAASLSQVRVQTKGKVGAEQDTEVWDARAVESPEKDNQLIWLLMAPKLMTTSKEQKAPAETEDALGHVLGPREGPEPDWDSLFHDGPEEVLEEARPWARVLPPRQVLHGPEEDRDHIYHPREP